MRRIKDYTLLVRYLGIAWILFRIRYALIRRARWLKRRTPAVGWPEVPARILKLVPMPLPTPQEIGIGAIAEAQAILEGRFRLFSTRQVAAGVPPDWHRNQLGGDRLPAAAHWTDIGDFAFGDIKGVWELSRFPWAFALVRAHVRSGDARYAEAFWRLLADWYEHNPPNLGPNWMCGQEATFRLMAVVFSAESLGVPTERQEMLARFVAATGRRIAANLDYALSQNNNHGISECVGLITCALLLPEIPESAGWLRRGLAKLQDQCTELVYEDGGFSQHSLIYHRLLLHDLCWARSRLQKSSQGVPAWLDEAGRRALGFLQTIADPATGRAPLYGSNDGADILPLADADFLDMRPVVQMASSLFLRQLPLQRGPWDEAAQWMTGSLAALERVPWPPVPARWHAQAEGCFQLVNGEGRLFLRCPEEFRHRPSQADMMHVDIWHRGRPIAMDGGSFSYNSRERFTSLGNAAHHNVLTIDGKEPMGKFSRFLYLPWPRGETEEEPGGAFTASHDGYAKLGVAWHRSVAPRAGGGFVVTDRLTGVAGHQAQWHWRLADAGWALGAGSLEGSIEGTGYRLHWAGADDVQARVVRADEQTARGWWSPAYGHAATACALTLDLAARGDVVLTMEFSW